MRERESAAEQIEEQQNDWAYSRPICLLHMVCLFVEYKQRYYRRSLEVSNRNSNLLSSESKSGENGDFGSSRLQNGDDTSVAKHLESANTMFSFVWWIVGFYWVSAGGQNLTCEAPQLYWLCITFLAFDVFFVVICFAVA